MIGDIKKFRFWCQKVLPLVYDNSLSYYEILCKVVDYLNKVIEDVDSIPEYIDAYIDEKLSDEHIMELLSRFIANIESAICANNEGTNTNSSKDYSAGEMLWLNDMLYLVKKDIDTGTLFIIGDNLEETNFEYLFNSFINELKNDFTENDEGLNTIASKDWHVNQWLWLDDKLYIVINEIAQGTAFIYEGDNKNVEPTNLETEFYKEKTQRTNEDNSLRTAITNEVTNRINAVTAVDNRVGNLSNTVTNLSSNLTAEITNRQSADTFLQTQIDEIVAPSGEAPSVAEVENARIGADGYTYQTLGVAIRSQFRAIEFYKFNATPHYIGALLSGGSFYRSGTMTEETDDFILIPVNAGDNIKITPNSNGATIAFLASSPTVPLTINSPEAADFSTTFTSRIGIASTRTFETTIYDDTAYIYVSTTSNSTDITPIGFEINGVDYASTLNANMQNIYGYNNNKYDIGRQLSFDNIINSPAISEDVDLVAHCSAFAVDEHGLAIEAYYGNENKLTEDYTDTSDAHVKIEKFNVANPTGHEELLKIADGFEGDTYTIVKGCPANPNVAYLNDKFYVFCSAWWAENSDLTTPDFGYKTIIYDTTNSDFDKVSGDIKIYTPVIRYNGIDFTMSNNGITSLLGALGIVTTDPYVQFTCNHAYNTNGYYYSVVCALYKYAFIVRTNDFINYEFVALMNDGTNEMTPEAAIQFSSNTKAIISYRVNDTATKGTYWATYDMSTSTFSYKGKISDSFTKPCMIKDFTNHVIVITGYPNKATPLFSRNGLQGLEYNPYDDCLYQIFKWDDYATAIHYPCAYTKSRITYISFTTGAKQNLTGTDYDTIQFTKFGYIQ